MDPSTSPTPPVTGHPSRDATVHDPATTDESPSPSTTIPTEELTLDLRLQSPHLDQPLSLPGLQAAITIGQLKETIRQTLPSRPADNQQRLIYRGRYLRDVDTLLGILGEENIRASSHHSIHLIVSSADGTPTPATPTSTHQGEAHPLPSSSGGHSATSNPLPHPLPPTAARSGSPLHRNIPAGTRQRVPHPDEFDIPRGFLAQMEYDAWRTMRRHFPEHYGRTPPTPGAGDSITPVPTTALTRHAQGPNYTTHVHSQTFSTAGDISVTINQVPGPPPSSSVPQTHTEISGIFRGSSADEATQTLTAAMVRSASGRVPQSLNSSASPFTNGSGAPARGGTPNRSSRIPIGGPGNNAPTAFPHDTMYQRHGVTAQGGPEVYIMNSPQGPQGILIHSNEAYVTPAPSAPTTPSNAPSHMLRQRGGQPAGPAVNHDPLDAEVQLRNIHQQARARIRELQMRQRARPNVLVAARLWQHLWLVLRLVLFVWWFTSPVSSLYRWLTVISIAVTIFVLNTGALDRYAEHAWRLICRHMENLIPTADRRQVPDGVQPQRAEPTDNNAANQNAEPDARQAARRLVARRRNANAVWLLDRIRRVERGGLVFLASIFPGVAERHIAHLEAEARRREAEAAAAEAARRAAEAQENETEPPASNAPEDSKNPEGTESAETQAGMGADKDIAPAQ